MAAKPVFRPHAERQHHRNKRGEQNASTTIASKDEERADRVVLVPEEDVPKEMDNGVHGVDVLVHKDPSPSARVILRIKRKRGTAYPDAIVLDEELIPGTSSKRRKDVNTIAEAFQYLGMKPEERDRQIAGVKQTLKGVNAQKRRLLFRRLHPTASAFWTKEKEFEEERQRWRRKGAAETESRQASKGGILEGALKEYIHKREQLLKQKREQALAALRSGSEERGVDGEAEEENEKEKEKRSGAAVHVLDVEALQSSEQPSRKKPKADEARKPELKQKAAAATVITPFDGAFGVTDNNRSQKKELEEMELRKQVTESEAALIFRAMKSDRTRSKEEQPSAVSRKGPSAGVRRQRERHHQKHESTEEEQKKVVEEAQQEITTAAVVPERTKADESTEVLTDEKEMERDEDYDYYELDRPLEPVEDVEALEVQLVPFDEGMTEESEWKDEDSTESEIDYPEDSVSDFDEEEDEEAVWQRAWRNQARDSGYGDDEAYDSDEGATTRSFQKKERLFERSSAFPASLSSSAPFQALEVGGDRMLFPGPDFAPRPPSFWKDVPAKFWGAGKVGERDEEEGKDREWEGEGEGEDEEESEGSSGDYDYAYY